MNKVEFIKGFDTLIEGLKIIRDSIAEEGTSSIPSKTVASVKDMTPAEQKAVKEAMNAPVEDEKSDVVGVSVDVEALKAMKYNEFKKYASQLGVKCTGTRDEIMERILALDTTATIEKVEETEEVEQETKSDKPARSKRASKAEATESTRDEFDEQAEEIAETTDVADIIEALKDVDIKATKKNAVQKLAEALRSGLIELDYEDEDDSEEYEEDEEEITAQSYFEEYDPNGYNNPDEMTDERAESVEAKMEAILDAIENEKLTLEDITSYLDDNATEDEIDLLGEEPEDEECVKLYMELIKRTIDNDGEEHEPSDPYELGEHDMCCGHELKYVKKTKKYVCEHCGTEYEAE